jgi:DNA-binding transcriptional MerR regulator
MADVTPRTVRYYIGQGLLASPGSGPNARYSDGHLARLRVIRQLQRQHLPLAEIRRRIEDLPDDEVVALAESPTPTEAAAPADSAADYVRRLLGGPARRVAEEPASFATAVPAAMAAPAPPPSAPPEAETPREPERSTWERHAIVPDVEIHVRRPLDRHTSKQVDRLIRIARDLLGDES